MNSSSSRNMKFTLFAILLLSTSPLLAQSEGTTTAEPVTTPTPGKTAINSSLFFGHDSEGSTNIVIGPSYRSSSTGYETGREFDMNRVTRKSAQKSVGIEASHAVGLHTFDQP